MRNDLRNLDQRRAGTQPTRARGGGGSSADGAAIRRGQNVWQSIGGEEVGSIWGHGAYVAPDWSADWLHRESVFVLDTLFAVGALVLGWFVLGLATGWSLERGGSVEAGSTEVKLGGGSVPGTARAAPEDGRR